MSDKKGGGTMLTLGIVDFEKEKNEIDVQIADTQLYRVLKITEKEDLQCVNGVVIPMDQTSQVMQVVDWIAACNENPAAFVWVFSKVQLSGEEKVMMGVGATTVISEPDSYEYLLMSIKNTFLRLKENSINQINEKKATPSAPIIDMANRSVHIDGKETLMTGHEFKLFSALLENEDVAVSYETLCSKIWKEEGKSSNMKLANIVFSLRRKLGSDTSVSVQTIRSKGYMLQMKNTY